MSGEFAVGLLVGKLNALKRYVLSLYNGQQMAAISFALAYPFKCTIFFYSNCAVRIGGGEFFFDSLFYCTIFRDFSRLLRYVLSPIFNFEFSALFIWQASILLYRLH